MNPIFKSQQQKHLGIVGRLLMRMFGRPKGIVGRLGGIILARTKRPFTEWVISLLEVQPDSKVLEVGFGPGVAIKILASNVITGFVAGVDYSKEMVEQAIDRNAKAIESATVRLEYGSVEKLPFADESFGKALSINSMQVWPDAVIGLREMHRVIAVGGKIAIAFSSASGQSSSGLTEMFAIAGFTDAHIVKAEQGFCVLAIK